MSPRVFDSFFDIDVPEDLVGLISYLELLSASASDWIPVRTVETIEALRLRVDQGRGTRGQRLVVSGKTAPR